jgi:hypothetical protein
MSDRLELLAALRYLKDSCNDPYHFPRILVRHRRNAREASAGRTYDHREMATSLSYGPFRRSEHNTITEVFEQYNLTTKQTKAAWTAISKFWYSTDGRFYAYNWAHHYAHQYSGVKL